MKNLSNIVWCSFSILFIVIHASSCKKDADSQHDGKESYTVAFKFKEFEQATLPLKGNTAARSAFQLRSATTTTTSSTEEGYLYFWSFNQGTLEPDIALGNGWEITYNQGLIPTDFATGWKYDTYAEGQALSIKGVQELIIKIPLTQVSTVSSLGFDISSSGTGPKSFALSYSQDGVNYTSISDDNQFSNTNTAQAKNTFTFQLGALGIDLAKNLYVKLIPKAGERGESSAFNEATGIMRLDNLRLIGMAAEVSQTTLQQLHYHIFDKDSKKLVSSGLQDYSDGLLVDLNISLPLGEYLVSFVTNDSEKYLLLPNDPDALAYFIGNTFSNYNAKIFGVLDTFVVAEDMEVDVALRRYYSQVKFELTDTKDLSTVAKIVVRRNHEPEFYAPFNTALSNPILDPSEIVIYPAFTASLKEFSFNQFIGDRTQALPLSYTIDVYDTLNNVIRSFQVETAIKNNVQLVFTGQLLVNTAPDAAFSIRFYEEWDDNISIQF
ncbi:hypothetical protein [Sphingobacterium sp. LRF_L2]|uniref:hypothetical protein n=1 Tax=Sphingobacterium sp. LRF_L2 TaxID=3369421 RepID=UPI003F647DA1